MRVTENIEGLSNSKKVLPISPEWVDQINRQMATTAKRYLYGSKRDLLEYYKARE